jgi:hypothetical protein
MKSTFAAVTLSTLAALAAAGCGPPKVRPVSYPNPDVPCPAGLLSWNLEVLDQRADAPAPEKMLAAVRDGVEKSFPGCRWSAGNADTPTITIAVHRFAAVFNDRYYDSAVDWTVTARTASGRTITEFDASELETRPAYSGADEESLNEAFRKALQRTVKGLSQIPRFGSIRPPEGTPTLAGRKAPAGRATAVSPRRVAASAGIGCAGSAAAGPWNGSRSCASPEAT